MVVESGGLSVVADIAGNKEVDCEGNCELVGWDGYEDTGEDGDVCAMEEVDIDSETDVGLAERD